METASEEVSGNSPKAKFIQRNRRTLLLVASGFVILSIVFCSHFNGLLPYPKAKGVEYLPPTLNTYGDSEGWYFDFTHCFYLTDAQSLDDAIFWYDPLGWMDKAPTNNLGEAVILDLNINVLNFQIGHLKVNKQVMMGNDFGRTCAMTEYEIHSPLWPADSPREWQLWQKTN